MKHYKKRTIALCLASLITVVGAFGAENYDNSLVGLKINNGSNGYVNLTAFTKKELEVKPIINKIDGNTYILNLPKTDNKTETPDITKYNNIESIEIQTLPYTIENDGCTKIIIKTSGGPIVQANTQMFIAESKNKEKEIEKPEYQETYYKEPVQTYNDNNKNNIMSSPVTEPQNEFIPPDYTNTKVSGGGTFEHNIAIISILALLAIIGFIYTINKDKMASIVGNNSDFDLDDENKNNKNSKRKNIRKTINRLDKTYSNIQKTSSVNIVTGAVKIQNPVPQASQEEEKDKNDDTSTMVVDLDALYEEKSKQEPQNSDNNDIDDLAAFLDEFTFEDTVENDAPDEIPFDEELYESIINNQNIKFTKNDIEKINELAQVEISDEMIELMTEYYKQEAAKPKPKTREEILENLLTTYSIQQNISFSKDDIDAMQKLMNVEIDSDFVTNLHTNPNRTKAMEKELKEKKPKLHKTSEILTLNVKDLLPDLSKELKKQGNKRVESNAKPETIYYSEGYEVSKLSVSNDIANISKELKSTTKNDFKPSYVAPIVENGYQVSTLAIKDELPDLADVKAHPNKYKETVFKEKVDENALIQSLNNVSFKPFYEETQNKINRIDDVKTVDSNTTPQADIPDNSKSFNDTKKLLKLIEEQQLKRAENNQIHKDNNSFKQKREKSISASKQEKVQEEVQSSNKDNIIKTVQINSQSGCKLIKTDNGYNIIGYIGNEQFNLKEYASLNNTNMQVRTQDKTNQNILVKVGIHKFIIKITENNTMEFVMDLC